MYFCIWKQSGKKSALLWTGMYQLFFCVFNTLSFAILKSSAMPWEKKQVPKLEGHCMYMVQ